MERGSIAKVSGDTLKIQAFLEAQAPGSRLTYTEIQASTDVAMDADGKQRLRSAAKRAHIEYACVKGLGIELASPQNGMVIVTSRLTRINQAVRRGDRCHRTIQDQFWHEMSPEDQNRVLFLGAVFGAIRAAAESGKRLYAKHQGTIEYQPSIPLPKL